MNNIIDQINDPARSRLRVVAEKMPAIREMAKTANFDPSEISELPDRAFAWPGKRLFPIHNSGHTALSYAFSKLSSAPLPTDVIAELERAATLYGIDKTAFEVLVEPKVAEDSAFYLLPAQNRFRVSSPEDIPKVERAFYEKYAQLSIDDRATAATRLMEAAQRHQVPVHPSTQKLAGFTMTSTRLLKDYVEARREASIKRGSMMKVAYDALAQKFQDTEPFINDRAYQVKLAQAIHEMDKQAGLTNQYGRKLTDPIQTVFNTEYPSSQFMKIGSVMQNKALLAQLPLSFWQDTLGDDIASEIAPDGVVDQATLETILPTLPADMKAALETQLAAYNR
jgi:hypothetical protein